MSQSLLFCFALVSGVCFGSISYAYQKGRQWHVPAPQIAFAVFLFGSLFFGGFLYYNHLARGLPPKNPWLAPWPVWLLSIVGGMGQVANTLMIDPAQERGPAAPVFCAMNLIFVPVAVFALVILKERITFLQGLGLAAAIGCILVAGKSQWASASDSPHSGSRKDHWIYPLLLMGMMVSASLTSVVMKQLQAMPCESASLFTYHQGLFLFLTYGCGAMGNGLVLTRRGWSAFHASRAFLLGGFAAVGSISGFLALCFASVLPGGIGFALTSIFCFVTIALIAAVLFKEKRNPAWYLSILLAIVSVILMAIAR